MKEHHTKKGRDADTARAITKNWKNPVMTGYGAKSEITVNLQGTKYTSNPKKYS